MEIPAWKLKRGLNGGTVCTLKWKKKVEVTT